MIKQKRNNDIRSLRNNGFTLSRIGEIYKISRERVRQITGDIKRIKTKEFNECIICGKSFEVKHEKNNFCSRKCFGESLKIKVLQINKNGKIIKKHNSISEASRVVNCRQSLISKASDPKEKRYKTAKNYYWERI
jgi:predicted nucleic acid-binding Zn ribbon protein